MKIFQQQFIQLCLELNILRFGDFTLKSGRHSPYFFNAGLFNTGKSLAKLGKFYAQSIQAANIQFDMLFGPAYKGITLAATTAIALADKYNIDKPYAFNRKEAKAHGEGGNIVGHALSGQILIIDDVITAGTAIGEAMDIIKAHHAKACAIIIALDRQEKSSNNDESATSTSAIETIKNTYNIPVISIINLENLLEFLQEDPHYQVHLANLLKYREKFGV